MKAIEKIFASFCRDHPYMSFTEALSYVSILGGAEKNFDLFEPLEHIVQTDIPRRFETLQHTISPSYILQEPYRQFLTAIARGNGKRLSAMHKARIGEKTGIALEEELVRLGVLIRETSREAPLKRYPKQKLKKELRRYRIQDKLRFSFPFYRFWFGFVEPFRHHLTHGNTQPFVAYYQSHAQGLESLLFEQLCNAFLIDVLSKSDPVVSSGGFWNKDHEFDILMATQRGRLILGECKYTARPVCKSELSKLQYKAYRAGMRVDVFALFSKSGFSNELETLADANLWLFSPTEMASMCQAVDRP